MTGKLLLRSLFALALCTGGLGRLAAAAETTVDSAARVRFENLPEAQREELRHKLRDFKALPQEERERIQGNLTRWRQLPPAETHPVTENHRHFPTLPPAST